MNDFIVIFLYVLVPVFFCVLFFCWLFFVSRGHRNVDIKLRFLGGSLEINSNEKKPDDKPYDRTYL